MPLSKCDTWLLHFSCPIAWMSTTALPRWADSATHAVITPCNTHTHTHNYDDATRMINSRFPMYLKWCQIGLSWKTKNFLPFWDNRPVSPGQGACSKWPHHCPEYLLGLLVDRIQSESLRLDNRADLVTTFIFQGRSSAQMVSLSACCFSGC